MLNIRRMLPALMMIGVVALSGCVYLRLLQFKRQFRDFHENFEFRSGGRYSLIIKKPLLSGDDIDFVMKASPTRIDSSAGKILGRIYDFRRDGGQGGSGSLLEYELRFRDDRFMEMRFPSEFSALFPEDGLVALLSSLGEAETDRREKELRAKVLRRRVRRIMPDRDRVLDILGAPSEQWREKDGLERLFYRYELETSTPGLRPHEKRAFGRFYFEGRILKKVDASLGGHVFSFEIP